MPIAPPSPETRRFLDALEAFAQNPPRDLPEGALDTITELRANLKGYTAEEQSPGEREVVRAANQEASDTGQPFSKATKGADQPTPGQQEVEKVQERVSAAVAEALGTPNG